MQLSTEYIYALMSSNANRMDGRFQEHVMQWTPPDKGIVKLMWMPLLILLSVMQVLQQ